MYDMDRQAILKGNLLGLSVDGNRFPFRIADVCVIHKLPDSIPTTSITSLNCIPACAPIQTPGLNIHYNPPPQLPTTHLAALTIFSLTCSTVEKGHSVPANSTFFHFITICPATFICGSSDANQLSKVSATSVSTTICFDNSLSD